MQVLAAQLESSILPHATHRSILGLLLSDEGAHDAFQSLLEDAMQLSGRVTIAAFTDKVEVNKYCISLETRFEDSKGVLTSCAVAANVELRKKKTLQTTVEDQPQDRDAGASESYTISLEGWKCLDSEDEFDVLDGRPPFPAPGSEGPAHRFLRTMFESLDRRPLDGSSASLFLSAHPECSKPLRVCSPAEYYGAIAKFCMTRGPQLPITPDPRRFVDAVEDDKPREPTTDGPLAKSAA